MMIIRKIVQFLFRKPLLWIISKLHSSPQKNDVNAKLSFLYKELVNGNEQYGTQLTLNAATDKIVIVSDVHKGNGNDADDFVIAKANYVAALYDYLAKGYTLIALGDIEELWENTIAEVLATHEDSVTVEKFFVEQNKFYKVAGNHDLIWRTSKSFADSWLTKMYGQAVPVHEAVLLITTIDEQPLHIFLTHGHQGDKTSDGNKFSKWFVANIWCKVQAYLDINPNAPSKEYWLRDAHNKMMYEWSVEQTNAILVTGHTHKPVFASASHIEDLKREIQEAEMAKQPQKVEELRKKLNERLVEYITNEPYIPKLPTYYNTGCCCYSDGDITLLEIANGKIELVKWGKMGDDICKMPLREISMSEVVAKSNTVHY